MSDTPHDHPPTARRVVACVTEAEDEGERADVVLGRRIPGLSRRQARALARTSRLRIDGHRRPPSTRVTPGQRLELELDGPEAAGGVAPVDVEALAITDQFVYVYKPAGIHTVALTPEQPGVLATAVARRWPECASASEDPREGGAVHRLDQPTSGVVAFARSREAWAAARAGFGAERVAKHYLAACERQTSSWPPPLPEGGLAGWLVPTDDPTGYEAELDAVIGATGLTAQPTVRIRAAIGRDGGPERSAVRLDGRRASTVVRPLAAAGDRLLVRLLLETGRRHQARVHLAWVGLPIVDDPVYGVAPTDPDHPAIHLHAFAIDLSDVVPGEAPVYAPPPPGFWPPGSTPG